MRQHLVAEVAHEAFLISMDVQGTVWSWLMGPFIDAELKVGTSPEDGAKLLSGLRAHLGEACIGSVSEVFDAQPPYTPRGCVAQAWGVAELVRVAAQLSS